MQDGIINRAQTTQFNTTEQFVTTRLPPKKGPSKFERFLGGITGAALNLVAPGAGSLLGQAFTHGDDMAQMQATMEANQRSMNDMFNLQMQVQNQTQSFTLMTNIMKAKHDAEMAAIHNLKS